MPQQIEVPGQGLVEFPDGMSDDDIVAAIKRNTPQSLFTAPPAGSENKPIRDLGDLDIQQLGGAVFGPADKEAETQRKFSQEALHGMPIVGAVVPPTSLEKESPGVATALNTIGGIAATAPLMAAAPWAFGMRAGGSVLGNALTGGVSGAGISAADAAARGEPVTTPTIIGGGVGLAGPVVGGLAAKGVGKIADWLSAPSGPLAGIDTKAVQIAANVAQSRGMTEDEITKSAASLGPKGFMAEFLPEWITQSGQIAAREGPGQGIIKEAFAARAGGTPARIEQSLTNALGPRVDIVQQTANREAARKAATGPLYSAWHNTTVPMTPELEALQDPLRASGAMQSAYSKMAIQDKPAADRYFLRDPVTGEMTLNTASQPKAETWDYMKRSLDDKIGAAQRAGAKDDANIYTGLKNKLIDAIDNHPDATVAGVWKAARKAHADPAAIQDAQDLGRFIVDGSQSSDEFRHSIAGLSDPQRQALIEGARGAVSHLMDQATRVARPGQENAVQAVRQTAINRLQSKLFQDKLSALVGDDKANGLLGDLNRETQYAFNRDAATRNSKTAERVLAESLEPPKENIFAKAAHFMVPHVAPAAAMEFTGIPEAYARQAQQRYAGMRGDMAKMYTASGQNALDTARALLGYRPPGYALTGPVSRTVNALMRQGALTSQQPSQNQP